MGSDNENPLLEPWSFSSPSSSSPVKPDFKKRGTIWTAVAHIITGVIGSGVLSLAWSMAQLGWIAGLSVMLAFASVTTISVFSLCNCYRSPDPNLGDTRNPSYLEAVYTILGKKSGAVCSIFVRLNFFKLGVVYTITSAISIRAIQKSNCYHKEGPTAACQYGIASYILFFGIVQIMVSQIPNFRNTEWLSIIAAVMSFLYAIIGSALGLAKTISNGSIKGSTGGVPTSTPLQKTWLIAQALGNIAFAFPFSIILLNIQDTLKSPPSEKVTMKKASTIAITITTIFYLCCGGFGYAAFGDSAPGNVLTGFYEPYWLVDFAHACIIIHLIGAFQVFSQPLFSDLEGVISSKLPNRKFINHDYILRVPLLSDFRLNLLRLCFRTAYVVLITGIAVAFPYFNQVVGFSGALCFWPIVIYFPTEMYIAQKNIGAWTRKWIILHIYVVVCLLVSLFAFAGSIEGLITAKLS